MRWKFNLYEDQNFWQAFQKKIKLAYKAKYTKWKKDLTFILQIINITIQKTWNRKWELCVVTWLIFAPAKATLT